MRASSIGDKRLTVRISRALLISTILVLFVYSGMMKWMPIFPVDPTVLFGTCLVLILAIEGAGGIRRLDKKAELAIYSTLAFFSWYLFTATYTVSDTFWQHKALTLGLSVLAFMAPVICFKTENHFVYLDRALILLALASTAFVLGFYVTGNIEFLLRRVDGNETTKIPNYLQLGSAIGVGTLLCLARPTLIRITIAVCCLAALLVLGARGPIVFTVSMIVVGYFFYSGAWHSSRYGFAKYSLIVAAVCLAFFSWSGAERTVQRFSAMLTDEGALVKGFRVSEFSVAGEVIASSPVFGVGLGGYGSVVHGADGDSYPHNLFLETFAEAGILGLALFILSIVAVALFSVGGGRTTTRGVSYIVLAVFYLLNYNKSGGFIGTRDLYMLLGVLTAYANRYSARQPLSGLYR